MQQNYWNTYGGPTNYYGQPYDGAGPANGYTPYPQQSQLWPSAATPYIPTGTIPSMHAAPVAGSSISRPQHQQQRRAATLPPKSGRPIKSALRRSGTQAPTPSTPAPLQRRRAISNPKVPVSQLNQLEKQRSEQTSRPMMSQSEDSYLHMFLSFHGHNEIHIEHLPRAAMDEIRREIFGVWPDGIELDELKDYRWRVRLKNAPWSLAGPHLCWAWKMLVKLFVLFEERGYSFYTSINIGSSSPRLVFYASDMCSTRFFLASFSSSSGRFCLIDAPPPVNISFSTRLHSILSGLIATDEMVQVGMSEVRVIELKRRIYGGTQISSGYFLAKVFSILEILGYQLVASLPMARKGPLGRFGLGTKQELLVFRSERAPIQ